MSDGITIAFEELEARARRVQDLLRPLRKDSTPVAGQVCLRQHMGCKVVAAHDGVKGNQNFAEWQFRTAAPQIWAQYYELWKPCAGEPILILNRAYLNMFLQNEITRSLERLVSIHCDPCEAGDTLQCAYKRGPHLHILKAEQPIPEGHFPLNYGHLDQVLACTTSIMQAMSDSIQILRLELLDRYIGQTHT